MNRKSILYISSGTVLLIILIFAAYISTFIQPRIIFTAEISKVSEADYKRILYNEHVISPNISIEKFRHVNVQIKVLEPIGVINQIKIERDTLQKYLKNNDKIQILGGGSFEHGNGKEYSENIEIFLLDLSEDELRSILENFRYKVTWKDLWNKDNSKVFYLRDYLK